MEKNAEEKSEEDKEKKKYEQILERMQKKIGSTMY